MKIRELLEIAQRQRVAIVAVLIVGLAAYIVALPHFKKYTATSTLLAASASSQDSSVLDPTKDPAASAVGLGDLENLATSASVLDNVERDLHLPANEAIRFGSEVKAKAVFGSDVLPVSVTDRDPDLAVSEVNSLATELSAYARNISTSRYDELIRDLRAQVAQRAAALRSIDARVQTLTGANYFVTMDQGTAAINARLIALAAQEQQLQATVDGDIAGARMAATGGSRDHRARPGDRRLANAIRERSRGTRQHARGIHRPVCGRRQSRGNGFARTSEHVASRSGCDARSHAECVVRRRDARREQGRRDARDGSRATRDRPRAARDARRPARFERRRGRANQRIASPALGG
jgi:capsular polysaccharide biosynthesis protein